MLCLIVTKMRQCFVQLTQHLVTHVEMPVDRLSTAGAEEISCDRIKVLHGMIAATHKGCSKHGRLAPARDQSSDLDLTLFGQVVAQANRSPSV